MTFYEAMNEVLQTSRYDRLMGRHGNAGDAFSNWFSQLMERIFGDFRLNMQPSGFSYDLSIISVLFAMAGVILAVVAAIVLFRTLRNNNKPEYYSLGDIFEELANNKYTVTQLIEISNNATQRRIAIRYRYIAALLALNEKNIIEIKPSATNAIIWQQIKETSPTLLPQFECTVDAFHLAWFGYKNVTDEAFNQFAYAVDIIMLGGEPYE